MNGGANRLSRPAAILAAALAQHDCKPNGDPR
jgi:hypothetical protein